MTSLYYCRTSLSEAAMHFGASRPAHTEWSSELRPGRTGLVIFRCDANRRVAPMRWGLPPSAFPARSRTNVGRTTLWFRELWGKDRALFASAHRCLVVLDCFALPEGVSGERIRCHYGLDDQPIFGWAGVWLRTRAGSGYAGFVGGAIGAAGCSVPVPMLLGPHEYAAWFGDDIGVAAEIVTRLDPFPGLYRQPTDMPWGADRES